MMDRRSEPVAIVGSGCRFPGGSNTPSKLWELLRSPRNVASKIPSDRFNLQRFYHPDGTHHGTTNVQESYFISEDVRPFDAQFFSIPPAEAEPIDPQHRVLLETIYEAVESAGLPIEKLQGSDTAVYVGLMCNDYTAIANRDFNFIPTYVATGTASSNASSRVSYFFDWHGPSMTIDTACSSSLVAVHQAVQTLRSGTSRVAVAAGTNLLLDPMPYVSESNLNMLSPTGRSRMWDEDADGYARGDGVAAVILKTLSAALEDGDDIECIIRETGVNQDGRTKGITMPSAAAQTSLIRDTYARVGLDPTNKSDRCQYFEAHGTGTPAGDPQEAEALSTAFFNRESRDPNDVLFVGSVKTVIGHTEGTAGLAGILKACMALKHATIPPNLLFNRLSASVEPFYKNLRILNSPQPWPSLPDGTPRRASVNSFGFGGTNAHAILESYESPMKPQIHTSQESQLSLTPFTFSAASEKSLAAVVTSYISYLRSVDSIDLRRLAYTLSSRRSALPVKVAFSATTLEQLCDKMEARLQKSVGSSPDSPLGVRSFQGASSIVGVFTGQGAQWATMGTKLISSFNCAYQMINEFDQSLAMLPKDDRPQWTIMKELLADSSSSRIGEAELSQPLCTAVQIVLVNLLRSAGIRFTAVVGHSSGEIAAAYTAGFISASDAIRIAYYRGLHAKFASGSDGKRGAMMAVGTSFEDAKEFCELEDFKGRLAVAASNSSASVTISGDADAIEEAKAVFEGEKKLSRVLKVDTAYHSHHMLPCSGPYTKSLQACNIKILEPVEDAPTWFSSVHGGTPMEGRADLKATYWVDNMTRSVLFSQALECALEECGLFQLGLEIGPHPALRGPATQTIHDIKGKTIPYCGTLSRGKDDVESFSNALGSVWTWLGASAVNFAELEKICNINSDPVSLIKGLPTYQWDHDRVFWSESRSAKLFRTQEGSVHELLGLRSPDGTADDFRWSNVLKPKEIPWLSGHALQGQTVFPGTGYIALAMEASMEIADGRDVKCIELCDLEIIKAIAIDDAAGTEILVTMTNVTNDRQASDLICAEFASYSPASKDSGKMVVNARGRVRISLWEPSVDLLPPRGSPVFGMSEVDISEFYTAMGNLGYGYDGPFRGMSTLRRRLGTASGTITRPPIDDLDKPLLFHPGMLDTSLQGMFAAFSAPGDGRLWSIHAPTGIRRVTLIPSLCGRNMPEEVSFDCVVTGVRRNNIVGDVDIFTPDGKHKIIEVDGIGFVPFTAATEADDRHLFAEAVWGVASPDGDLVPGNERATPEETQKAYDCERVGYYYLRTLNDTIGEKERTEIGLQSHHEALLDFAAHINELVLQDKHQYDKKEWISDSHEQICALMDSYGDDADFNMMRAVGENLAAVIRGETTILEHMTKDGRLDDYYQNALGFATGNMLLTGLVAQISHKFPHMNILEIGAGTGGATGGILSQLGTAFTSYTYTDISSGFFEKAQERFKKYASRMVYKPLNIEKDPTKQGFPEHTYDLVLAANVLHATKRLEETLRNARRLLKPGGYLVLLEIINSDPNGTGPIREGVVMGALPGWWIGRDDGRRYAPTVSLTQWNSLLKKSGFAGIDTSTPLVDPLPFLASAFAAQAVDSDINVLRRPLRSRADQIQIQNLILLGGKGLETSRWIEELEDLLGPYCGRIITAGSVEELHDAELPPMCTVLSLADLDSPVLKGVTKDRWETLKRLFTTSRNVLWITRGYRCEEPYAAMMVGLCRSIIYELSQLRLQLLDIDYSRMANPTMLAELLLRLQLTTQWEESTVQRNVLWTMEPELVIENEHLKIVRVLPQKAANERYNSAKRLITKDLELDSSIVNLQWHGETYVLREGGAPDTSNLQLHSKVLVDCSLLSSLRTVAGRLFISLGVDAETGMKVLSVSEKNASTIRVPNAWSTPVNVGKCSDAQYLSLVAGYLASQQILTMMPTGGTLLVHEPDALLALLLSAQVEAQGSRLIYTTSNTNVREKHWVHIHPRMPKRSVDALLPNDVSLFLDFSADVATVGTGTLGSRIAASIPKLCERGNISALIAKESMILPVAHDDDVSEMLRRANSFASTASFDITDGMPLHIVALRDVLSDTVRTGPFSIVNWREEPTVPTMVEPIDARKDIFNEGKTYWLVGLAGDLGQSICDWMIGHGARYIVLTSRSTKVAKEWIQMHAAKGVTIAWLSGDITKMEDLKRVHSEICQTFPEIAGVANGALILRDTAFANMDLESFNVVLKPKVDGTVHLSELFNEKKLEFFIAFSSIVATTGNSGQSAYSAANCFMKALIAQRRKRGLAGSIVDISRVLGVGYVERERKSSNLTEKQIARIMKVTSAMSEADLHQLFAEAVVAGRPNSGQNVELITGIRIITADATDNVFWAANIKFSHFIQDLGDVTSGKGGKEARVPVKTQLLSANSANDMVKILKNSFTAKLKLSLQLSDVETIRESIPLIELGVDSLVAVEVRAWFLQELVIDLPVLKILGGASVADLVDDAMQKLPQELLSKLPSTSTGSLSPAPEGALGRPAILAPPLFKENPIGASSSDAVPNPHSETSTSARSAALVDSVQLSSSSDVSAGYDEPLSETPFTEACDDLKEEISKRKGEGSMSENTSQNKFRPEIVKTEPMSYGQSRFWFLKQYLDDKSTPNVTFWFQVMGHIQADRLRTALDLICQRHESLRTCFFANGDEACQGIMKRSAIQLERKTVSGHQEFLEVYELVKKYVYDIERGDTLRVILCEESANSFYLIVGYHHITMDGFSWEVFFSNLEKAYKSGSLPPVERQYAEWASNQRRAVQSGEMATEASFWIKEFSTPPPILPLFPMAQVNSRQPLKKYEHHKINIKLDSSLTALIKERCRSQKVSPFHFHLAVFKTLLFRFLSTDDLCIGIADANRTDAKDTGVIGFMLNLLPLRFQASTTQNFITALKEVRNKAFAALAHSKMPFNVILEDIDAARNSMHSPVFQAFIDYRQADKTTFADFEGYAPLGSTSYSRTAYDVALNVLENYTGESVVTVGAQRSLYSEADTEVIANSYFNLLQAFAKHPATRVAHPQLFANVDVERAIERGRGPSFSSTWPMTLLHRIDEMVSAHGKSIAIKDGYGNILTYAQMARRVDSLAADLAGAGVTEGSIAAVFQQPTTDWICSMLAIMRLGAIYVPLDYRNGLPRLAAIVKACQPRAILVDSTTSEDAQFLELHGMAAINITSLKTSDAGTMLNRAKADQAGIILFTSGTTGIPKGIMLKHSSLRNQLEALIKVYNIGREVVLQQTAFSFDLSIDETFLALCTGGTLYVVDKARRGDSQAIMKIIASEGITYTRATPPEYSSWIRHGASYVIGNTTWRIAFGGGDRLTNSVRQEFRSLGLPQLKLYNSYGPTEITLSAVKIEVPIVDDISPEGPIPIGMPMPNYSIYILDENLKPAPLGVPGEIVVGGAGVSLGYLNEARLTNENFLDDPWAPPEYIKNGWTKMYRTGDKGRLIKDGSVLFHGRIEGDTQIKLRGIRLELGDIESTILSVAQGALSDVVCTKRGNPEFLVAHAVFSPEFLVVADDRNLMLRQLLTRLPLPEYMKPAAIFPLESMPLTVHLKRDRRAIAALPISENHKANEVDSYLSELTELESEIKDIWQKLLPKEMSQVPFTPSTNFFRVGGNSLLLVEMQAMIRNLFDVAMPLLDLFEANTLGKMAAKIQEVSSLGEIDWTLEGCPPDSASLAKAEAKPLKSRDMEVLLTGATGHLGRHLLPFLVSESKIAKIHCVAVRNTSRLTIASKKIVIHTGDLSEPLLGLSVTNFTSLASNVDAIIHCGAQRSFWEPYRLLRKNNVHPTKELIKLAGARKVPIHFLSSGGIVTGATASSPATTSSFVPSANGAEGYLASKWVSERMLERANTDLSIPAHIYRTTSAAELREIPKALLDDFSQFSVAIKMLPERAAWSGTFDVVHADDVAKGVCDSVANNAGNNAQRGVKFVHFPAVARIGSTKQLEMLVERPEIQAAGIESFELLPVPQWMGRLKAAGFGWMVAAQDATLGGRARSRR